MVGVEGDTVARDELLEGLCSGRRVRRLKFFAPAWWHHNCFQDQSHFKHFFRLSVTYYVCIYGSVDGTTAVIFEGDFLRLFVRYFCFLETRKRVECKEFRMQTHRTSLVVPRVAYVCKKTMLQGDIQTALISSLTWRNKTK